MQMCRGRCWKQKMKPYHYMHRLIYMMVLVNCMLSVKNVVVQGSIGRAHKVQSDARLVDKICRKSY